MFRLIQLMRKRWNNLEITSLLMVFLQQLEQVEDKIYLLLAAYYQLLRKKKQLNNKYEKQMFYGK